MSPYGAVETSEALTGCDQTEDNESSTLLGTEALPGANEGPATIVSSVSNLSNTIIGSGASFPWSRGQILKYGSQFLGMLTFPLVSSSFPAHSKIRTDRLL